ncbi:MAG: alpha-2-macroglobulin, partial [Acidobacteria bacterium]|nr:alpha-2-macroglobulin [Acidobacteriota bacterium]
MKIRLIPLLVAGWIACSIPGLPAQQQARVETFSPESTVKAVRQVRALFSEAMVPFGDPRAATSPFDVQCPVTGVSRWVDERNWVYDFEHDLPGGIRCRFRIRPGLRSLAGNPVTGRLSFDFSTGGPAIRHSEPYEGSEQIDEEQVFVLSLDCPATEPSVLANVSFAVDGIASRIGARIVTGAQRDEILESRYSGYRETPPENMLLLQARQRFPAERKVNLIWGRGVESPGGVTSDRDQVLRFITRPPFTARFHCSRENPEADCIPLTSMVLSFSSPVLQRNVRSAVLRGPEGKIWLPDLRAESEEQYVHSLTFRPPFPERSAFILEIPPGIQDDAGRTLDNADKFPLTVNTAEYPPLAKFSGDFGILELTENPLLPVTVRNVEPDIALRMMEVREGEEFVEPPRELRPEDAVRARLGGRIFQVPSAQANQMLHWIRVVQRRTWEDREHSVFGPVTAPKTESFSIPRLEGPKAFEVVGVPIRSPGFHVVEIESELLGAALLGKPKPMYVPTTVLVTNLSVHFKWGIDSSLVWVTTLDKAEPVRDARVEVRDCEGKLLWEGATGSDGIAGPDIPSSDEVRHCS